mmetsp:Transcript_3799/g.7106  ORF Transcript_3799/g.7106 Transcript_3799/m.7106 type:complete len:88 (-) Transcript_3799:1027-1290(-)
MPITLTLSMKRDLLSLERMRRYTEVGSLPPELGSRALPEPVREERSRSATNSFQLLKISSLLKDLILWNELPSSEYSTSILSFLFLA